MANTDRQTDTDKMANTDSRVHTDKMANTDRQTQTRWPIQTADRHRQDGQYRQTDRQADRQPDSPKERERESSYTTVLI